MERKRKGSGPRAASRGSHRLGAGFERAAAPLRVVQMGLGPVGASIARQLAEHAAFRLVGAVDPKPGIAGRDLGEVLGIAPLGVAVGADAKAVLARMRPRVVVHATGSRLVDVEAQLRTVLAAGASVVSTCEELSYPWYRHPVLSRRIDALARRHGVALLGTGINPGFVMDKLVVTLMSACRVVRSVRVRRVVDASRRREPLQRKIGAGISLEEFESRRRKGRIGHVGLPESAHMVADAMGLSSRRRLRDEIRPVLARAHVVTPFLEVQAGRVAGIAQTAVVDVAGRERVRLEIEMYVGAEQPGDVVTIDGEPNLETTIAGGIHGDAGTAAMIVSCARLLPALAPGLRTMLDVPLR